MNRLLEAVKAWDEDGHVGQVVDPDYCDCETCRAQTELREALEEAKAS